MRTARALLVLLLCAALGGALVYALLQLPPVALQMPTQVATHLDASGVTHAVTAVLLNFRGYDTLLEVAVLLLALLGVLAGTDIEKRSRIPGARPGLPILQAFACLLVPLMVLVAGYLLWAGAHAPGGAFQAAAVLAAAAVLLHLARMLPAWATPRRLQRWGLVAGLLLFLGVAALPMATGSGFMLQYPPAWAGALILLVETGLSASLGLLLAGLFLSLSDDGMEFEK
jgi:multisubunit Na+/H+ antiporter MnhB subunit